MGYRDNKKRRLNLGKPFNVCIAPKRKTVSSVGFLLPIMIILAVLSTGPVFGDDSGIRNIIGLRTGVNDSRNNEDFYQREFYAAFTLPFGIQTESNWTISPYIGFNAGTLFSNKDGFIFSAGPGFYILTPDRRFGFSAGIYPTYIDRYEFGEENLGGALAFTSQLGLNFHFLNAMTIGYCFQHMSNAGIFDSNPGLNTHSIELGYRF